METNIRYPLRGIKPPKYSRTKTNVFKWSLAENDKRECGEIQDEGHVYECPKLNAKYTKKNIEETNDKVIQLTEYWHGK
ncbi:Hypothetical protein CINCED_3A020224 [Cinara cedri]|uniref:Uncharacterized protein n=1 Tax=Cinara cedri TaxID=506608 RepID=A0A5E4M6L8_9HEMI|nr:Hypothetical protein CINCED_3A020224 [Cinara cedri]